MEVKEYPVTVPPLAVEFTARECEILARAVPILDGIVTLLNDKMDAGYNRFVDPIDDSFGATEGIAWRTFIELIERVLEDRSFLIEAEQKISKLKERCGNAISHLFIFYKENG